MAKYVINGGKPLEGAVTISGAKNAAVAILPAAILVDGKCRVENVPDISDVRILLDILEDMGAAIDRSEPGVVTMDCSTITKRVPDPELVRKMRASYYLMGALLSRFGEANVALPGGCNFLLTYLRPTTRSYNPTHAVTWVVWALPRSLATTGGIIVIFFSCRY